MPKTLKQALFEPWNGFPALFASQKDLAAAIASRRPETGRKEKSVATFLSQILGGTRPCPPRFKEELIVSAMAAARAEMRAGIAAEGPSDREVEAVLSSLMDFVSGERAAEAATEVFLRQLRAKEVVIVNPLTLEGRGHPRAGEFQHAMITAVLANKPARYLFVQSGVYPSEVLEHERQTRLGILAELSRRNVDKDEAEEKLKELKDLGVVKIRKVSPSLCSIPMVAFDADGPVDECDVYVWDWWKEGGRTVDQIAKLSEEIKRKWVRGYYRHVVLEEAEAEAVGE